MTHVLIADDDSKIRSELKQVLEKNGYNVIEAATARETILQAQDHEPDLMLLDIKLPDMPADLTRGIPAIPPGLPGLGKPGLPGLGGKLPGLPGFNPFGGKKK